jgi:hypothetical protein
MKLTAEVAKEIAEAAAGPSKSPAPRFEHSLDQVQYNRAQAQAIQAGSRETQMRLDEYESARAIMREVCFSIFTIHIQELL